MLRLPDGSRVQRRFACDAATVADLYDWAEAQGVAAQTFRRVYLFGSLRDNGCTRGACSADPSPPSSFPARVSLVTAFPRTVYAREALTLQAVGLQSQTALLVEASE